MAERDKTIEALTTEIQEKDATIARCDKEIADLDEKIAALKGIAEERDKTIADMQATIDKLTAEVAEQKKSLAEKESEIKELADKPTPMTTAASGVPADNGTGDAQKAGKHQRIRPGMTYAEIRALNKQ